MDEFDLFRAFRQEDARPNPVAREAARQNLMQQMASDARRIKPQTGAARFAATPDSDTDAPCRQSQRHDGAFRRGAIASQRFFCWLAGANHPQAPPPATQDVAERAAPAQRTHLAAHMVSDVEQRLRREPTLQVSPEDVSRRSVRRLALYLPFGSNEPSVQSLICELVLGAAHQNGGTLASAAECRAICEMHWGLQLELDEIRGAMGLLMDRQKLVEETACFRLSESSLHELASRVRSATEVEAVAFLEWEGNVRRIAPALGELSLAELREDLTAWLYRLILEHGVEAALLIRPPEEERFRRSYAKLQTVRFDFLPPRDASIMAVRQDALRLFIDDMTPIQRHYFQSLLATAYCMSSFTLDSSTVSVIRQLTGNQRLYLDTNIVYSLLKLHGSKAYLSTQRTLALSRDLGYQLCVTPWTVAEMKESMHTSRLLAEHRQHADGMLDVMNADNTVVFSRAYRHMQRETGITFDDFLALYEEIELLLGLEGIKTVATGCQSVEQDRSTVDEQVTLLRRRVGSERPRARLEREAKHRLLIEQLRGGRGRKPSNAGYLMLTNDHVLVRHAEASREQPSEAPFAVAFDRWAEGVRALSPRTLDYEKTVEMMLDAPYIRTSGLVSHDDVIRAMARIDLQERYPATIAARMLLDTALTSS